MPTLNRSLLAAALFLVASAPICAQSWPPPFPKADRDGDGSISASELPRQVFQRFDADGNGTVSRQEYDQAVQRIQARRGGARQEAGGLDGVDIQRDVAYADTNNPRQRLDLYLPKKRANQRLPLIVYIHGGGWRSGSKQRGLAWLRPYLKGGTFAGASIGYRLTDEAIWPAQLHDCKAALRWLKAHADKYGYNPDRIAVIGSSAGSHLACLLGTTADCSELEGKIGSHRDQDSRVRCVVNFFGPTAFLARDGKSSAFGRPGGGGSEGLLFGGPPDQHRDAVRQASSVTHASTGDAPVLTLHGSLDPIVPYDQAVRLEEALQKANVSVTTIKVEGARHGGFHQMPEVIDRVQAFLSQQLLGAKGSVSDKPIDASNLPPPRGRRRRSEGNRR